jgi:nucleoside-diphosphate-sugar epimerase
MKKVLLTGSQGFIGSYIINELLTNGYSVVGVDNYSKYGKLARPHDTKKNFVLHECDVLSNEFYKIVEEEKPNYIISAAAMIGGISYFHKYAYDLLATNERINAQVFDAAINGYKNGYIERIIVLSSSMVFEEATVYPTPESAITTTPPPASTYGFSKLAVEYFCKGAYEQYGLPYSIVRPFNCVGVGEDKALNEEVITSGNVELMLSHVLPDLINKCLKGQNPLHILGSGEQIRCYTNGRDLARGIRVVMESEKAINNDYNISTSIPTSVLELAELVWNKINPGAPFNYTSDTPYEYDVQKRYCDVSKATNELGFTAEISLEESIEEVIAYMTQKHAQL